MTKLRQIKSLIMELILKSIATSIQLKSAERKAFGVNLNLHLIDQREK